LDDGLGKKTHLSLAGTLVRKGATVGRSCDDQRALHDAPESSRKKKKK